MLLNGISFVFRIPGRAEWTATLIKARTYTNLYVIYEKERLHIRHFFNRYLAKKEFSELERQVFRSQSTEDLLAYGFVIDQSIKTILEWPPSRCAEFVQSLSTANEVVYPVLVPSVPVPSVPVPSVQPKAPSVQPKAPSVQPFDLFYKATMEEPIPQMPANLQDKERADLQKLFSDASMAVTVKSLCGSLDATLELDGTFSLQLDEDVTMMRLNSFELLWYLKQDALKRRAPGTIRLLQQRMAIDPDYALRYIFFTCEPDKSLSRCRKEYEEDYGDMPALIAMHDIEDRPPPLILIPRPMPVLPESLRQQERQSLKALITTPTAVGIGYRTLDIVLERDGSFTFWKRTKCLCQLDSWQLLWHLQRAYQYYPWNLTERMMRDPTHSLRCLYLADNSTVTLHTLCTIAKSMQAPSVPVPSVHPETILNRLRLKKAALEADSALLQEAIRIQEQIQVTKKNITILMEQLLE